MGGQIEQAAADTLLERGIPIPIAAPFFIRWFGKKEIHPKIKSPYYGTQLRVSSYFASTGLTVEALENISVADANLVFARHGKVISKIIACALINTRFRGWLFTKALASYLRWNVKTIKMLDVVYYLIVLGNTRDFLNIIRSAQSLTITAPNLSQPT
ncbi:hypothetical protein ACVWYG_002590 [Pedobacter sp. UYEF25]